MCNYIQHLNASIKIISSVRIPRSVKSQVLHKLYQSINERETMIRNAKIIKCHYQNRINIEGS